MCLFYFLSRYGYIITLACVPARILYMIYNLRWGKYIMNESIKIGEITVDSGKIGYGNIKICDLFADGQPLEIPFTIINGNEKGPCLYIQIAQHPNETWGLTGVYNVLKAIDPEALKGTIIFSLPNPVGFRFASYYPPYITHDINRVGIGNPEGTLMERIVDSWWINFVEGKADYVIDIHGVPQETFVYYEAEGVSPDIPKEVAQKSERMAILFGSKSIQKQLEAYGSGSSFRGACVDHGIPAIVPEVSTDGAGITETGIKNIMIDLDMIKGNIQLPDIQYILKWTNDRKATNLTCSRGGCFLPKVKVGDIVKSGDEIGILYNPRNLKVIMDLKAHKDGYISSINNNPVKVAGESLLTILDILEIKQNK